MIVMIALACGGEAGDSPAENDSSRAERAAPEESPATLEVDGTETGTEELAEEEEAPEATPAGPERVRFRSGESQGRITIALGPGESRRYVVGVASDQYFHIGIDDDTPTIKLLTSSMLRDSEKGDTFLDGMTTKSGDIVFEFSNPTSSPVRTFALVTIKFPDQMDH